jgi:hypothetical protein
MRSSSSISHFEPDRASLPRFGLQQYYISSLALSDDSDEPASKTTLPGAGAVRDARDAREIPGFRAAVRIHLPPAQSRANHRFLSG